MFVNLTLPAGAHKSPDSILTSLSISCASVGVYHIIAFIVIYTLTEHTTPSAKIANYIL